MEQGFPGTVDAASYYLVGSSMEGKTPLIMAWTASTPDEGVKTPINMTNHAYWNLSGDFADGTIGDHFISIEHSQYLPMGPGSIPTG